MKILILLLFALPLLFGSSLNAVEPEIVEIQFNTTLAKQYRMDNWPKWLKGVENQGGMYLEDDEGWSVSSNFPDGHGKLLLSLDRTLLNEDLAISVFTKESLEGDLAIQLYDSQNRVIAVDLFANFIEVSKSAGTDTVIIPLRKYDAASKIVIRRVSGTVQVQAAILFPVITEVKTDIKTLKDFASYLGDPINPNESFINITSKFVEENFGETLDTVALAKMLDKQLAHDQSAVSQIARIDLQQAGYQLTTKDFMQVAKRDDVNSLELFLLAGMEADTIDEKGKAAIHYASYAGATKVVNKLLEYGATLNLSDTRGRNALTHAIFNKQYSLAIHLLLNDIDLLSLDKDGNDAMHHSIGWHGTMDTVRQLMLFMGYPIDRTDKYGNTILHKAIEKGNHGAVELLLLWNANPFAENDSDITPYDLALKNGDHFILYSLKDYGVEIEIPNPGDLEQALSMEDAFKQAAINDDARAIEKLIREGVDINASLDALSEFTALHFAADNRRPNAVRALIENGANLNVQSKRGTTPLYETMGWGGSSAEKVRNLLLKAGADVNLPNNNGTTPIMRAAMNGHIQGILKLLQHGGDLSLQDNSGKDAIDIARNKNHTNLLRILQNIEL